MTPAQLKAARSLLGWSRDRLAGQSDVPAHAVGEFERGLVGASATAERLAAIRAALELAGIEFTDGDNPGVSRRRAGP